MDFVYMHVGQAVVWGALSYLLSGLVTALIVLLIDLISGNDVDWRSVARNVIFFYRLFLRR